MKKFVWYILWSICGCASIYFLIKMINAADARINVKNREIDKYKLYYFLCSSWIDVKARGKDISEYLRSKNMNTIAVYGMGDIGNKFCKELQGTDIKIKFVMDANLSSDTMFAPIKKMDDDLPEVDAIIVTPINVFSQIKHSLSEITDSKIVSIEDIIYNV